MLKSCTKKYSDKSDERAFRFIFYCDGCKRQIEPRSIAFTEAEAFAEAAENATEKKLLEMLWLREHDAAFGRADSEARDKLYECPCCHEYVCNDCVRGVETPQGIAVRCSRCRSKTPYREPFGFTAVR